MGSVQPKTNLLLSIAALAAAMGARFAMGQGSATEFRADASPVGNRSRMGSNRAFQRAALKKRNQARHRKACRG